MSFFSWLAAAIGNRRSAIGSALRKPKAGSRKPPRFRPKLEALENRMLPSTYSAATASDLIADINAANKHGGANTIVLTAPTTSHYVLTAVDNTTDGSTGLPIIKNGCNLTIVGNGDTIERSSAAGTPAFRLLDIGSGGSLTLQNLTLQNGLAFGSGVSADGGAIFNRGTLSLSGVTVQNNIAHGSNGTIKKTSQPGADAAGGGIWSNGALTLQGNTTIQGNQALGGQGGPTYSSSTTAGTGGNGFGGGVFQAAGSVTVTGAVLSGNTAFGGQGGAADYARQSMGGTGGGGFGGGFYEAGGSAIITTATLTGNTAQGGAGGECFVQYPAASGNGGIGAGGGLYVAGGTLNLGDPLGASSVTVQSNLAQGGTGGYDYNGYYSFSYAFPTGRGGIGYGGGIYIAGGTATLASVDLWWNTAQGGTGGAGGGDWGGGPGGNAYGGALDIAGYVASSALTLTNDSVTGNDAIGGQPGGGYYGWGVYSPGIGSFPGIYNTAAQALTISACTVYSGISNYASGTWTINGSTVWDVYNGASETLTISHSIIFEINNAGALTVSNSFIIGNLGTFTDGGGNTYTVAPPQIGSFTASPNPLTNYSSWTLTASDITDTNPGGVIVQVQFYVQINGATYYLGYGTQSSPGVWTFSSTDYWPSSGTYTLFAVAGDNYGASSAWVTTTLQVN